MNAARNRLGRQLSDDLKVLVVREADAEVGDEGLRLLSGVKVFGRVGEGETRLVAWADADVADRADAGLRSLAREELLLVAREAGGVFGLPRHVGDKHTLRQENLFPPWHIL